MHANSNASASIDFLSTYPARDDEPIISRLISSNYKNPYIVAFTEVRFISLAVKTCGSRIIHVTHSKFPLSLLLFLLSTKWNANVILACDFAEFVALCKVISWKTHIPVRTQKLPPRFIFAGAYHGQ